MGATPLGDFSWIQDWKSSPQLVPEFLKQTTNTEEIDYLKAALVVAVKQLKPEEKQMMKEYYYLGMTKTQIAKECGITSSALVKRMQKTEKRLGQQLDFALHCYQYFKREQQ